MDQWNIKQPLWRQAITNDRLWRLMTILMAKSFDDEPNMADKWEILS